jgi:tRNA (mo5U34)-methyltransferase
VSARTDAELRRLVGGRIWFHTIELRPGITTPGKSDEHGTLAHLDLPADLSGLSVLDIGCWDGFFSFECERRGAARVVASDVWETAGRGGFDLAREELASGAEPLQASVYDLPEALGGERFDLVLFLGVLYHLKHPLLALEKVAQVTAPGGLAVIETVIDKETMFGRPSMVFFPGAELNRDPTNWWAPNPPALGAMLVTCGFGRAENRVQLYAGNRTIFHATKAPDEVVAQLAAREDRERHHLAHLDGKARP